MNNNNNNTFMKNFREVFNSQSPRVLTKEERSSPTFSVTKGQMPSNYGQQQNIVGSTALAALSAFLDPTILPALLAGAVTLKTKEGESEPVTIIDREKVQKNFEELPKIQPLSTPNGLQRNRWIELPTLDKSIKFVEKGRKEL